MYNNIPYVTEIQDNLSNSDVARELWQIRNAMPDRNDRIVRLAAEIGEIFNADRAGTLDVPDRCLPESYLCFFTHGVYGERDAPFEWKKTLKALTFHLGEADSGACDLLSIRLKSQRGMIATSCYEIPTVYNNLSQEGREMFCIMALEAIIDQAKEMGRLIRENPGFYPESARKSEKKNQGWIDYVAGGEE
jgi:hypothetical protein